MKTTEKLIPQLRFPEFEGEWGRVKLKDVSQYFNGGSFENDVSEKGKYELITLKSINVEGRLVHSKRYIDKEVSTLEKNTLVMILSEQAPGLLGMTALIPVKDKYVLNQRVAELRPNSLVDSYFLSMGINRNQRYFSKLGAGTKVQNITKPNVENYEFLSPNLPEQQKIAAFLTDVDAKITQLTQKKTLLEQYKKGVMQKIFNQELRFKPDLSGVEGDDEGNNFPDWEEKKLGLIGSIVSGLTYSPNDIDENGVLVLRSSNVKKRLIALNDNVFVNVAEGKFNPVELNDILICVRNGSKRLIGKNAIIKEEHIGLAFGAFMTVYRSKYNRFLFHFFDSQHYKKEVHKNLGATINSINGGDLKKFKVPFPCIEEQTKIANFLSDIDIKIEALNVKIANSKTFKKGLLQQLFV